MSSAKGSQIGQAQDRHSQVGQLEAIWVKRSHGGSMDPVESAVLAKDRGIVGNADQGGWRQVTLLSSDQWAKAVGKDVSPQIRRANLLISGIDFYESREWKVNIAGNEMLVRGETKPCRLMDELRPGLQEALRPDWGGGAYAQVLSDGEIKVGDEVFLLPPD